MSTEYIRKSIQDSWRSSFSKKLTRSEAKQASRFRSFLKKEYFKGVDKFVESGSIRSTEDLFPQTQIKSLYIDLYESVGVDFASWYQRNIKKFLAKSAGNKTTWSDKFGQVGEREAARKVVIVQGTAKAQLINVVGRLFKDKDFQDLGRAQQARILKSKFGQISAYQAERIVRTEATNAANQGILQSATDIFGKNMLQKEWVASGDSRTRSFSRGDKAEHLGMDGTVVDYDQRFSVPYSGGIDLMMHPGDPSAHAVNVINCRCSIAVIPKEDAEVNEGLELTGFGGGLGGEFTGLIGDDIVSTPKPPVATTGPSKEVQDLVDETLTATSFEQAEERAVKLFKNAGLDVQMRDRASNFTVEKFNKYNDEIARLTSKYDITGAKNDSPRIELSFKSTWKAYGFVERWGFGHKKLTKINFGNITDKESRLARKKFNGTIDWDKFSKSQVDEINLEVATVTHEFAHVLSINVSRNADPKELQFWSEIRKIKRQYDKEKKALRSADDLYNYNELYLGSYANTNMNEFFAEAFTEFELNTNPSKYAKLVGELAEKYFKK